MDIHPNNQKNIDLIKSIIIEEEYPNFIDVIYESILDQKKSLPITLDFAGVATNYDTKIKDASYKYFTADINKYEKIDFVFDLCDKSTIPKNLIGKFDNVIALAILEHVWNPFKASENLVSLLNKNKSSKLWIFAPFLYPYPAPDSLIYQDYFRFTKDSWAVLFPTAKQIKISPIRGRATTAFLVGIPKYKNIEKKLPILRKFFNNLNKLFSKKDNQSQVSGYCVTIEF